jgi:(p)ppGpp synthase/HD superfamily hydrolase
MREWVMGELVERAKALAHRAHAGQVDKAGRPYIEHVARVAAAVADDPEAEAVAWLHDVLEDCAPEFCDELVRIRPDSVFRSIVALTRGKFSERTYYARIRENPIALRVKLADIADNSDEARLALLDDSTAERLRKKYRKALNALGVNGDG